MQYHAPLHRSTARRHEERDLILAAQEADDHLTATPRPEILEERQTDSPVPSLPTEHEEYIPSNIPPNLRREYKDTKRALHALMERCRDAENDRPLLEHLVFASPTPSEPRRLDHSSDKNRNYFLYKEYLRGLRIDVEEVDDLNLDPVRVGIKQVMTSVKYLEDELERRVYKVWDTINQRDLNCRKARDDGIPVVDTSPWFPDYSEYTLQQLTCWLFVTTLHYMFRASRAESNFVLDGVELIANAFLSLNHTTSESPPGQRQTFSLNRDLNTIIKRFGIYVPTKEYVVCPECCALRSPGENNVFAATCGGILLDGVKCSAVLGREVRGRGSKVMVVPRKRFEYQSPKDWLGQLLSRPGMEDAIDETLKDRGPKDVAQDIWDGTGLPAFKWRDGTSFWEPKASGLATEVRLAFSLSLDWFAAIDSAPGGKAWSVGAIYLTCLCLPHWLRDRPENICLAGIIPGPTKPHEDDVHHFLDPLVEDLVEFWTSGVYLSRTARCLLGRLARAMLAFVCCDMDACRVASGFASHTSEAFCCYCNLLKSEINNLDPSSWTLKTREEHAKVARCYVNAHTKSDRMLIRNHTGYRKTPFLRLEYYDTIMCNVLDCMHLGKRVWERQLYDIWKVNLEVVGGDGAVVTIPTKPKPLEMVTGRYTLRTGTIHQVNELPAHVLSALCLETECTEDSYGTLTKDRMTEALQEWRNDEGITLQGEPAWADVVRSRAKNVRDEKRLKMLLGEAPPPGKLKLSRTDSKVIVHESLQGNAQMLADEAALVGRLRDSWQDLHHNTLARCYNRRGGTGAEAESKEDLAEWIRKWEKKAETRNTPLSTGLAQPVPAFPASAKATKATRTVFGSNMLDEYRDDWDDTMLPDTLPAAPRLFGTISQGKLKVDELRMLFHVHLVITLPRLWGDERSPREFEMLQSFCLLAEATSLLLRHSTTAERRATIQGNFLQYIRSMLALFPQEDLTPYHHLSLHLPGLLEYFSATTNWIGFGTERFNGQLQRSNHNHKFYDLEHSMLSAFCGASQLRAAIADRVFPPELDPWYDILDPLVASQYRGTLDAGSKEYDPSLGSTSPEMVTRRTPLGPPERSALLQASVRLKMPYEDCSKLHLRGRIYAPIHQDELGAYRAGRNSYIVYKNRAGVEVVGRIRRIVRNSIDKGEVKAGQDNTFIFVEPFKPLPRSEWKKDPYRQHPGINAHLVMDEYLNYFELIRLDQIIAHVARCRFREMRENGINEKTIVVVSLDRS